MTPVEAAMKDVMQALELWAVNVTDRLDQLTTWQKGAESDLNDIMKRVELIEMEQAKGHTHVVDS